MYHGMEVPGFPAHPHRGFETVTVVRKGLVDHSDSMGATARYGEGDTQWLTTGRGIQHAEMFPLVHQDKPNPLDLFQLWLNMPAADKMCDPYFTMFWGDKTPLVKVDGEKADVLVVAGPLAGAQPLPPPPNSYASRASAEVAIWVITIRPGGRWTIPAATSGDAVNRSVFVTKGTGLTFAGKVINKPTGFELKGSVPVDISLPDTAAEPVELLLLQGKPIGEPVAQRGPFVMNTNDELRQAFMDYQRTSFGGWPWPSDSPVHPKDKKRFALHPGGRLDEP